jgi:penicillin amidase
MDPDSEAALIFHYTLIHLLDMVYGDKIATGLRGFRGMAMSPLFLIHGFSLRAETRLLELINEQAESIWYMEAKTRRARTREELLQEALSAAVRDIRKQISDNARKWDWGRSHQIRYAHALGSARFLRRFFNRGPFPIGGDGTTPMLARQAPELPPGLVQVLPSYRQIYEVGAWDRAQTVTTAGQSGHPLSDHYDDQIAMFCEGVYHPMPWSDEAVEDATIYRMTLVPDGTA